MMMETETETETYLTPELMTPLVKALVTKVANWDAVEQTWEIYVPMPVCIHAPFDPATDYFDDLIQWHEWTVQNSVEYSCTVPDHQNKVMSVTGLNY